MRKNIVLAALLMGAFLLIPGVAANTYVINDLPTTMDLHGAAKAIDPGCRNIPVSECHAIQSLVLSSDSTYRMGTWIDLVDNRDPPVWVDMTMTLDNADVPKTYEKGFFTPIEDYDLYDGRRIGEMQNECLQIYCLESWRPELDVTLEDNSHFATAGNSWDMHIVWLPVGTALSTTHILEDPSQDNLYEAASLSEWKIYDPSGDDTLLAGPDHLNGRLDIQFDPLVNIWTFSAKPGHVVFIDHVQGQTNWDVYEIRDES